MGGREGRGGDAGEGPAPGLTVVQGDITLQRVDAIVNAANSTLLGGGGVDGAIHAAAGPGLLEECRKLGGCPPGEARITGGHGLAARHVIHTVGPVWRGGAAGEDETLARCYRSSLRLAEEAGLESVAFPSIATGAYGFPVGRACRIAIHEVRTFLAAARSVKVVKVVAFGARDFEVYREAAAGPL